MLDSGENSSFPSTAECFNISLNTSSSSTTTSSIISKRKKCKNKRRFSDDQIRSLETMFQTETKLEPKKKVQLARELGLQPRQVAIWFQNKRARWKSEQLDRDYSFLCSNYNNLASQLESLKKEKQFLLVQVQKLNDLIDESEKEGEELCDCRHDQTSDAQAGNCSGPDVVSINTGACNVKSFSTEILIDVKPGLCLERSEYGVVGDRVPSDDESSRANPDYLGSEEEALELFSMVAEPADSSLTFPEEWGSLDSNAPLEDQQTRSSCAYQWWDFWS